MSSSDMLDHRSPVPDSFRVLRMVTFQNLRHPLLAPKPASQVLDFPGSNTEISANFLFPKEKNRSLQASGCLFVNVRLFGLTTFVSLESFAAKANWQVRSV